MGAEAKRSGADFSIDILFSEPLHFELEEIIAAVNEDYPSCQVKDPGINPSTSLKTDAPVLALLAPVEAHDGGMIKLIGAGVPDETFRNADHTETYWRSAGFGQEAMANHKSYLHFSVDAVDETLAASFRAARLLTAVTAVFAKLPITLGIYVTWSSHLVRPDRWVAAADQAVTGSWPLMEWLSYRAAWNAAPGQMQKNSVGYTCGLTKFLGYELHLEAAPIQPTDALQMLMGAVWMPLEGGSVYEDGNTVGVEGGTRYRIRRRHGPDGTPLDIFVLIHPDSPIDEEAEFGPNPVKPTPMQEPYINRPKKGFMRGILGRH